MHSSPRRSSRLITILFPVLVTMLTISPTAQARILEETGTLRGFLFGTCEECTYDNLVAHMSEGIARANYNVYNPLDPQNDEFGDYQLIPSGIPGDLLLASWRSVFERMIEGDYSGAEATREDLLPEYPFEIVHLTDTETGRDYYILREQIDSSFVDVNQMEIEEDDVVGSFAYGWGVYVYATDAMHPRVTVQVVHPNDDYICPYVAFDFFQTINAGQLFSTTAGREVRWTQIGYYTNSKSLSDPSRNARHVYQMAHETWVDHYLDEVPGENPFLIQVHSYDTRNRQFSSALVTPGYHDRTFNLPLYDWSGVVGGMIDRTNWTVHPAGVIGNPEPVVAVDFYGTSSEPPVIVVDDHGQEQEVPDPNDLYGYRSSQQFNYRAAEQDRCTDDEWFFHVECDELPNSIEDSTEAEFYAPPGYPLTWRNFETIVAYYHPMVENLLAALDTLTVYVDTEPPEPPTGFAVAEIERNRIDLSWTRGRDPRFETYRIYYGTEPGLTELSPFVDRDDTGQLCAQSTEAHTFLSLLYDQDYYFRISAVDQDDRETPLSDEITGRTENTPRVLLPNGGEIWSYSALSTVQWAGVGYEAGVGIDVNRNYPLGAWERLVEETEDDGEETVILGDPLSSDARIRVSAIRGGATDVSDGDFEIVSWQGYLAVTPAGQPDASIFDWTPGILECPLDSGITLDVVNSGRQMVTVAAPDLAVGGSFHLDHDCPLVILLGPGGILPCTISLTYEPAEEGPDLDTLIVATDASNADEGAIRIPLAGEQIRTPLPLNLVIRREAESIRLAWNPGAESILGCPIDLEYEVWYTYHADVLEYYLGSTTDTTWTHPIIMDSGDVVFYRVIAETQ